MSKPLGVNQLLALDALRRRGGWPGGWVLDNTSGTVRVLESLVRRGLVAKRDLRPEQTGAGPRTRHQYEITNNGRVALEIVKGGKR